MVGTAGKTLWVLMNGLEVGRLSLSNSGELAFAYSESWLDHPQTRPISFSLPLQAARHTGSTVFNYFDNLLPDNLLIRQRIQAKFDIPTSHPFDLLAAIGKDCVSALQFTGTIESAASREVRAVPLTDEDIARILTDAESYPIGMGEPDDEFRISLAGAQDKTAFLRLGDRGAKTHRHGNGTPSCLWDAVPLYGWGQQAAWERNGAVGTFCISPIVRARKHVYTHRRYNSWAAHAHENPKVGQ